MKEIRRGMRCSTKWSPISEPAPTTTLSTPAGRPAASKMVASRRPPVSGVSEAGLSTTALPHPRAGATERMESVKGKFHGLMTPTTPSGSRKTKLVLPGVFEGRICPVMRVGKVAASRREPTARLTSTLPLITEEPDSARISWTTAARFSSIESAARLRICERFLGGSAANSTCAASAVA